MTDQTPSGNRWEPADPGTPATAPAEGAASVATPPPAPAVPERRSRWRALLRRPGRQAWLAAGLSALVVSVGIGGFVGGFVTGRASVDDRPGPVELGESWHGGPGGVELPERPFGDEDDPGEAPGRAS
ncbi:MAG TPA: hypothetical protein VD864_09425 [Nocardioides sp.]|nr:hypothetical protein [Nocardioides sp.]